MTPNLTPPRLKPLLLKPLLIAGALVLATLAFPLRTTASPPLAVETSARDLLRRVLPRHASQFTVQAIPPDPAGDVFEIESQDGKIVLRGNSGVSIATALNYYLKEFCHAHHSFTGGSQLRLPKNLPEVSPAVRRVATARHRYFLNYCCFGYSLPWFDWSQWESLVDWMAMNGINLPLAVTGQEAVWQAVTRRLGLDEQALRAFLAGPPYLPFGWMGCLDGHGGPLPQSWIDDHVALQQRILARQRALGMTPVLQGFTGHAPAAITKLAPTLRHQTVSWVEWNTLLLDPLDPWFARLAALFLEEQTRLFGTDHYYAADTFIEMVPPSGDTDYLAAIGRAIYAGLQTTDPRAVWVLQGWPFFFGRTFWTQPRIAAVLDAVPNDRMLVLDLFCENTPVWSRTEAFCGKPWLWCNIQNFGNRVFLGGALPRIHSDLAAARRDPQAGQLVGIGFVNEGLDYNPVVFDYLFENAWRPEPAPLEPWLHHYSRRAYGQTQPSALQAWDQLRETAYQAAWDNPTSVTLLPSLNPPPSAPYPNHRLAEAWRLLLEAAPDLRQADPFRFDLVNVSRQTLANLAAEFHRDVLDAFHRRQPDKLRQASRRLLDLLDDLDRLLATRREFLLGSWLEDAKAWGHTPAEKHLFEWNARRVLTLWGQQTHLRDYACRQWSGLIRGFYRPRWEFFLDALSRSLATQTSFDEPAYARQVFAFETNWSNTHESYPDRPHGDSVRTSARLWQKYRAHFQPDLPSLSTGKPVTCSAALPGHGPELANDGRAQSTDAYWATDVTRDPAAWWQVDLERPTPIDRIQVVSYYGDQRSYGFTVETSLDGLQWRLAADCRQNLEPSTRVGLTCPLEPHDARFVRITQTRNSANTGRHLVEVAIFGPSPSRSRSK